MPPPPPEVIAHRGYAAEHTENTMAAFTAAVDAGVNGIELDVHATADGTVVVHHDPDLATDDGARQPIARLTWKQIQTRSAKSSVPRLTDVLEAVSGQVTLYVEIKGPTIEGLVCSVLQRYEGRCAVHSFDHRAILRCRAIAPRLSRGVLMASYLVDPISPLRDTGARDLWQHWDMIDEALVSAVHAQGGRVIAWTVNSVAEARRLSGLGVDGICTDNSPTMRETFLQP